MRDDIARDLDEVRQHLDRLLPTVPEHTAVEIDEPVVEVILPYRLLGHPVEQWELTGGGFPVPLGIRYPVVVRSLERIRDRAQHDSWRRKWRWVAEHGSQPDAQAVHCVRHPGDRDARALYAQLAADDHVVCLAIAFPPDVAGDEFRAGIAAGLPIIVWANWLRQPTRLTAP